MRLSRVPATELNAMQRPPYDDMRRGIEANFRGFVAINQAGQLIGPWRAALELCLALAGSVAGADSAEAGPAMTRSAAILKATPVPGRSRLRL